MQRAETKTNQGFTIIEVLIVLAIAGLIMLIVFEAIPALSRSSRNNQRRQDVTAILQAVSHYELNNSANYPDSLSVPVTTLLQYSNLSYYDTANIVVKSPASLPATEDASSLTFDQVVVYDYQKCSPTAIGQSSSQGSDYSDIVALYALETGSGSTVPQCQQL